MNDEHAHPFKVHVWSWDDIEEEIRFRPGLVSKYYPDHNVSLTGSNRLTLSLLAPRDQITAFFSRPEIEVGMARGVRDHLLPVAFEFAENAFRHGKASRFSIQCINDAILFEDDGKDFNHITRLDPSKASPESYIGSFVFDAMRRRFGTDLQVVHERLAASNRLAFRFSRPLTDFRSPQRVDIHVDLSNTYSRQSAYRLAASIAIPDGATEIGLVLTGALIHSGVGEFILAMIKRLKDDTRLIISIPDSDIASTYREWFKDPRVRFIVQNDEKPPSPP